LTSRECSIGLANFLSVCIWRQQEAWSLRWQGENPEGRTSMLLLIIVLLLLFGGGGGYYGYSRWGSRGGLGIVGTVVVIAVVVYLLGGLR
jgi:hypothetical protein